MRCKVKSNSMGYDGHIYRKDEYVDVISSEEVERLLGYGLITVSPLAVVVKSDPEPREVKKPGAVKTPDTSVIKGQKRGKKK